jgi:hypothetical protein
MRPARRAARSLRERAAAARASFCGSCARPGDAIPSSPPCSPDAASTSRASAPPFPSDTTVLEFYLARVTCSAAVLTARDLAIVPVSPASRVRHELQLLHISSSRSSVSATATSARSRRPAEATAAHLAPLSCAPHRPHPGRLRPDAWSWCPTTSCTTCPSTPCTTAARALIDDFVVSYPPARASTTSAARRRLAARDRCAWGFPTRPRPTSSARSKEWRGACPTRASSSGGGHGSGAPPPRRDQPLRPHRHPRAVPPRQPDVLVRAARHFAPQPLRPVPARAAGRARDPQRCGTGLNVAEGGDELLGLVRGLLYAGRAPRW